MRLIPSSPALNPPRVEKINDDQRLVELNTHEAACLVVA